MACWAANACLSSREPHRTVASHSHGLRQKSIEASSGINVAWGALCFSPYPRVEVVRCAPNDARPMTHRTPFLKHRCVSFVRFGQVMQMLLRGVFYARAALMGAVREDFQNGCFFITV